MNNLMIPMLVAIIFVPVSADASLNPTNTTDPTNTINGNITMAEISDFGTQMDWMRQFNNGCTALESNPGVREECISVIIDFNDYMDQLWNNHNATISKYAMAGLEVENVESGGIINWENLP